MTPVEQPKDDEVLVIDAADQEARTSLEAQEAEVAAAILEAMHQYKAAIHQQMEKAVRQQMTMEEQNLLAA